MAKRILAVDDSRTMRSMVSFTLRNAGFEVCEAEDGAKALSTLGSTPIDAIISDLNMPGMDGLTLIRSVRADAKFRRIPIIILTTEADGGKKAEARAAGATGWIVKPFVPETLVSVVHKVCP